MDIKDFGANVSGPEDCQVRYDDGGECTEEAQYIMLQNLLTPRHVCTRHLAPALSLIIENSNVDLIYVGRIMK